MLLLLPALLLACGDREPVDTDGAELLGILVTPERAILPLGEELQLQAKGLQADRSSTDLTHVVQWHSSAPGVAEVSNDLDAEGLVSGNQVGTAVVTASLDGIDSVPVEVQVTDASLLGLTVEPKSVSLQVHDTVQLIAWAGYSDGTRADSSGQVRWLTDDGSVAQLESGGLLTAAGAGQTTVHAEWGEISSSDVSVTVLQQAQADLRISGVEAESGGGWVTLTATVENKGTKGASTFFVDLFVDPSSTPKVGDQGEDWSLISYVGPDETERASFSFEASPGTHEVVLVVDTEDKVQESNEGNNVHSTEVEVSGSSTGANLSVDYFDYIADDTYVYYVVDVYNSGTEDVGAFYVDVYVNEPSAPVLGSDGDEWVEVSSLAAGDTESADFLIETWCYSCMSWVLVDSYDTIEESDETDNVEGPLWVYSE